MYGVACLAFFVTQSGGEDGGHLVIVFGGDGIELVIVAAGAGNSEAHEGARGDIDLIVDYVIALERKIFLSEGFFTESEKASGDDAAITYAGVGIGRENIAGELLTHEFVVRHVVVEGLDDVIAIAPGMGITMVFIAAGGIGVAHDVEPVAAPAFAITGGCQEAVD